MSDHLLAMHRRDEEEDFASTVTITRDAGQVFDETTGTYTSTSSVVYSGPCQIRPRDTQNRVVEFGGRAVSLRTYEIRLPADTAVEHEDSATVDSSPDAGMVGLKLRVLDVVYDDWQVSRLVIAESVS